jgi:NAD(P)-dependent dehydrogenase (short-subunit alcohol dehydrogenase family)
MSGRLQNKVALVTGSTRGLGRAIALEFAKQGAKVAVTGRNEQGGRGVVDEIRSAGGTAEFVRLDLSDESAVKRCVEETVAKFGGLDILVNNAAPTDHITGATDDKGGTLTQKSDNTLEALTTEGWRNVMTPGLDGLFWMKHYAIPELRKRKGASIVNISTTGSLQAVIGLDAYTASKGAMNSLTRSTAVACAPDIRVNCVVAGLFATEGLAPLLNEPKIAAAFSDVVLTEQIGQPEDVAGAVVFLASDEAKFITGQLLQVDGGQTIRMNIPAVEAVMAEMRAASAS